MSLRQLSYAQVQRDFPKAWESLPEPFKNDSVLEFFIDINGHLCASGNLGVGEEEFLWDPDYGWLQGDIPGKK